MESDAKPPKIQATDGAAPSTDGVTLNEASRRFIETEAFEAAGSRAELRLPARVVFRDGAVSNVGAPLAGRVLEVHAQVGDRVAQGAPLVTLGSPDAASARAALTAARAALTAARAAEQRAVSMLEQGVGTERERLDAGLRVAELSAELARARATASLVGAGSGSSVVVRAAMDGTVISRAVTVGAAVADAEELVLLGDPSALWVEADVSERDLSLIQVGQPATLRVPAVRDALIGEVVSVGAVVDAERRTAPVRIALTEPPPVLRPGMFGDVRVSVEVEGGSVPTRAVLIKDGRDYVVYVASGEGFQRRAVRPGVTLSGQVQILEGISPGEQVVVAGALLLDAEADQLL
ncbi:MAG: efflux RND transporter periplasmic adaptor subunit [Polyangiaceae bacterium]|nr:efflux RND transporter periplasmic adaptor subunit [Polyangiaceae bacterium]